MSLANVPEDLGRYYPEGYALIPKTDAAIEAVYGEKRKQPPEVILSDIELPGRFNGVGFVKGNHCVRIRGSINKGNFCKF